MTKISVINLQGETVKDITLNKDIWNIKPNDTALYDALKLIQNSRRQGTADTKTRSEVSGGGRKPYRQKGTGNARQGSTRAPHFRTGGIVFGPHPRKYNLKQNKKERRLALLSALAYKVKNKELIVVENLDVKTNKTKDMVKILSNIKAQNNTLLVDNEINENLDLSTRNIPKTTITTSENLNVLDIVSADCMVVTENAVKKIEEVLA